MARQMVLDVDPEKEIHTVVLRISAAFGGRFSYSTIERVVRAEFSARSDASVRDYVSVLVERKVRRSLRNTTEDAPPSVTRELIG